MLIALIEDDPVVRLGATQALELGGLAVCGLGSGEELPPLLAREAEMVVLSDVRLPGADGFAVLARCRSVDAELPVILMTGHGDIRMAVEAMRAGAYDFLEKPFSSERLVEVVRRAAEKRALVLENRRLQAAVTASRAGGMIGQSAAMTEVRRLVAALAPTNVDVLITGETGSGKEVLARALHEASARKGPFVAINCGALPESVFESEIFGHEAGAFTGAVKRRVGKLEHARAGTVFLDEIESLPLSQQVKLLRALQERAIERLGGNAVVPIDCCFIAAAKADLKALAETGRFRADLYFRLHVARIQLPPLRTRREDLPLLAARFLQEAARRYGVAPPALEATRLARWAEEEWPGNVREFKNAVERFCLGIEDAAGQAEPAPGTPGLVARVEAYERAQIEAALGQTSGNVAEAAEHLGLPKKTLYDKLTKYRLIAERFRNH